MPQPIQSPFNHPLPSKPGKSETPKATRQRSNYEENQKPKWDEILNAAIKGFARVETKPYDAFQENGANTSTETIYYDAQGNKLASVFNVRSKSGNHNAIQTKDAEYFDWDMDCNIDCKDINIKS